MKKLTIQEMQNIAALKKGKCLSIEYKSIHTKLKWQCSLGHTWYATAGSIKSKKSWCPVCGGTQKKTIEDMKKLAEYDENRIDSGDQPLTRFQKTS